MEAVFGLEVNRELPFPQGGFHGLGDGLLPQHIIVDSNVLIVLFLDAVRRQEGTVAHFFHRDGTVGDFVNAPFHHDVLHGGGPFRQLIQPHPVLDLL